MNTNGVANSVNVTQWRKDFFTTEASSAFQSIGFGTISAENINARCKYYWQPWLSDSADVGAALLHKWGGSFFDDTIVSAFHTTDSIIKQYSLHNFPAGMFTGRKQSPLEEDLVALLKPRGGIKTNKNVSAMIKQSEPLL